MPTPAKGSPSQLRSRDDSSLFSLQNLAQQKAEASEARAPSRDDSGLIDLAALAAEARRAEQAERSALSVSPFPEVGLFDAPAPKPEPAPIAPAPAPAPTKRNTTALIAGAAALAAVASVVAVLLTQQSQHALMSPGIEVPVNAIVASIPEPPKADAPKQDTAPPVEAKPNEARPKARSTVKPPGPVSGVVKPEAPKQPAAACDLRCQMEKAVAKPR